MCKIYIAYGINDNNREGHTKLYEQMALVMSEDKSRQDGLGYAAIDKEGNLFGERWLVNSEAFNTRELITTKDVEIMDKFKTLLHKRDKYNKFGEVKLNELTAMTLHTRLATSGKEFINTHPFVENDTSLIHNGVIQNFQDTKLFRQGKTSCDSEVILTKYIDIKLNENLNNVNKLTKNLRGNYACGIFNRDTNGTRHLDILKSSMSNLVAGYIKELDSVVFTSLLSHLKLACEKANLTLESHYDVNENTITRINPFNGIIEEVMNFKEINQYSTKTIQKDMEYVRQNGTKRYTYEKDIKSKHSSYLDDDYCSVRDGTVGKRGMY